MSEELVPFIDEHGQERRCGSLLPPDNLVSAFPPYAGDGEQPLWEASEILRVVRSASRMPARERFKGWILNQRSHGSCNGYAGAGAYSRARWAAGIQDRVLFSGAFLYSKINGGRDAGSILEDGMRAVQQYGMVPESVVPWDMIYPRQQPAGMDALAAKEKGFKCFRALTKQGWDTALATGLYFGIAAIQAGRGYQTLNRNGISGVDNGGGNHAICVDDICEVGGTLVYDSPGSWGTGFGTDGYTYLTWDSFAQTFGRHTFYLIPNVAVSN